MQPVLEAKSTYKGYPYVVLFMPGAYRCGYVGVPYSHKLAKKSTDDLGYLDCHGGLDLIVVTALTDMMLMQRTSILKMIQISKEYFTRWKISEKNQTMIQKLKSARLLMSKMSAKNSLTRLKRSDTGWIIEKTLM